MIHSHNDPLIVNIIMFAIWYGFPMGFPMVFPLKPPISMVFLWFLPWNHEIPREIAVRSPLRRVLRRFLPFHPGCGPRRRWGVENASAENLEYLYIRYTIYTSRWYMCKYMSVYIYICIYVYNINIYMYMYVYIYVYIYIHVNIYYIHIWFWTPMTHVINGGFCRSLRTSNLWWKKLHWVHWNCTWRSGVLQKA